MRRIRRLTAPWKTIALLASSCALCLVAAEISIRLFVPVRNVGPSFSTYDPFYGKTLKRSVSVTRTTPEFTMRFTSNTNGYRGPELTLPEAGSLVFVGDSFTMGYGVTDGEEFPAIIRKTLATQQPPVRLEVVNTGMGDTGSGYAVKFLRRDAAAFEPRMIVLQIHDNDFSDNVRERLFGLDDAGGLIERPVPPPSKGRRAQRVIESVPGLPYSHLVGLLRQLRFRGGGVAHAAIAPGPESTTNEADRRAARKQRLMLALQAEIVDTVRAQQWPLLVVLADIGEKRQRLLEDFFGERGVPTVSIFAKTERPDLYFETDGHWNAAGHAFVAERVLQALEPYALERW